MPLLIVSTILYCAAFMLKVVILVPLPDVPQWVVYGGLIIYGSKIANKGLWWDILATRVEA